MIAVLYPSVDASESFAVGDAVHLLEKPVFANPKMYMLPGFLVPAHPGPPGHSPGGGA